MIRKHFTIDDNVLEIIDEYHKKNKLSYSKTLSELIIIANDSLRIRDSIHTIKEDVGRLKRNDYVILQLLKQLYSDLEIDNSTNPNENNALQLFFNKLKGDSDG